VACSDADSEATPAGDCKGECMNTFGYDACPCGGGPCSEDDYGEEWNSSYDINGGGSMEECGDCKGDCADADSEATPAGTCKGQCMDTFGTTNCPCGSINTRCIEGDESSHSHDGDSSSDDGLLNTDACGACKMDCAAADPPSDDCKSNCMNTFGWDACPCGDGRCSEDDHGGEWPSFYDTVQPCWDCKVACSDADSEATPAGDCKGQCMDTFGTTNCPCGGDRCTEDSSSDDMARRDRLLQSDSSDSDDSHTHGHDATELAGTHYEDTRPCADCKGSCETDTPEFVETEDGVGCKSQCHIAYDPFCTCGGQICGDGFEDAEGPYTVFLPTDAAFADLDSAVGGLANVDTDVLCKIIGFHVVAEQALSLSDLSCETGDGSLIEMANGVNSRVKCTKDVPYGIKGGGNDKPANFVDVDIQASDGYVHIIDNVLFYPAVLSSPFGQTTGGENIVPSFRGANIP